LTAAPCPPEPPEPRAAHGPPTGSPTPGAPLHGKPGIMSLVRPITRHDIKGPKLYGPIRDDYRKRVIEMKRSRRILVGDRVSLVFENRHTLALQIEEILRAESLTREDQIEDEIAVYNQLMPTESSLSATLFIELPGATDPYVALKQLVGLDEHVVLHIPPHAIPPPFTPTR